METSTLFWSARRCTDYLLDRGVYVTGWPECAESALDCVRTLRCACANLASGESADAIATYIARSCQLQAERV